MRILLPPVAKGGVRPEEVLAITVQGTETDPCLPAQAVDVVLLVDA